MRKESSGPELATLDLSDFERIEDTKATVDSPRLHPIDIEVATIGETGHEFTYYHGGALL